MARARDPMVGAEWHNFIHAGDVAILTSFPNLEEQRSAAHGNIEFLPTVLRDLSLALNAQISRHLFYRPKLFSGWPHEHPAAPGYPDTKRRGELQHMGGAAMLEEILEFDPYAPPAAYGSNFRDELPVPVTPTLRILGVTIDMFFAQDAHIGDVVAEDKLRQGILSEVADARWGLEVGVL